MLNLILIPQIQNNTFYFVTVLLFLKDSLQLSKISQLERFQNNPTAFYSWVLIFAANRQNSEPSLLPVEESCGEIRPSPLRHEYSKMSLWNPSAAALLEAETVSGFMSAYSTLELSKPGTVECIAEKVNEKEWLMQLG
jgi:hypothetical protein